MTRRVLFIALLFLLGSVEVFSQQSPKDTLPSQPMNSPKHIPIARGDPAAEYQKWKSLSPEQRLAIVEQVRTRVLALRPQQPKVTQQYNNISDFVDSHWKELQQLSLTAPDQPRKPRTGRKVISVRTSGRSLNYPAKQVTVSSDGTAIVPNRPICGYPPDPDCCEIYGDCEPSNIPPTVTLSASPTSGIAPVTVTFTATASDRDGYIVDYFWNFGDGQSIGGVLSTTHTYNSPGQYNASFTATDDWGDSTVRTVQIQVSGPPPPPGSDADGDGISDSTEAQVGDLFTPYYHVSTDERSGTAFGIMGDYVPETAVSLHGPVPPYSYFRVKPYGFYVDGSGTQYGVLRIDYLTLWNRDDGLSISGGCQVNLSIALGLVGYGVSEFLSGLGSHSLDNERSLMLVSAPTSGYNTYNANPYSYSAYFYYTAAHEGTLFDQSAGYNLSNWPAGTHPQVALATAKHGTYMANPNGLPLTPPAIIASAYFTLDDLYYNGWIDDYEYWVYYYAISDAFYGCIVEHFAERGGTYADVRTNVGEPTAPTNGSHFILDPGVLQKLQ